MKKRMVVLCMAVLMTILAGCTGSEKVDTLQFVAMDTAMRLTVCDLGEEATKAVLQAGQRELYRLDSLLSRTNGSSTVAKLNETKSACVDAEVWGLMESAQQYAVWTQGCFDMTVAPLVSAWGFTEAENRVPEAEEIETLVQLVGSDHIHALPQTDGSVAVTLDDGCCIDLGGIAKGYAADVMAKLFAEAGVGSGIAALGGNVLAQGKRPDGAPWRVGVRDPQNPQGENAYAAMLALEDAFAVTSGSYERYFEQDGVRYHHIIDPRTGYPARSGLVSVTVVAGTQPGSGTMCDALSTALFVMGEEAAVEFWRSGVCSFEMMLITEDGRVVTTAGLADRMTPMMEDVYRYEEVS